MKILLVVGLFYSTKALTDNVFWQQSTSDDYQHSINTQFEVIGDDSKNVCVAIEPSNELMIKLIAKQQTTTGTAEQFKADRLYRYKIREQKVLCMSQYNNGRQKMAMFSYFDGEKNHRVHCQAENGDLVCYNTVRQRYHNAKHVVLKDGGELIDRITQLNYRQLTSDGKLFRLQPSYASNRQKAFKPHDSKEEQLLGKIKTIETVAGKESLPICRVKDNVIVDDSFVERPVCHDSGGRSNLCSTTANIKVCKWKGRGILIKQDDGNILRVANCEYQPEAMHFYCSGKLQDQQTVKVYFERYGVQLVKKRSYKCPAKVDYQPRHGSTAHIERLTCTKQVMDRTCETFASDLNSRCYLHGHKFEVREEGCNFYPKLEAGQRCPEFVELLEGLGCNRDPRNRYEDPCDFRYSDDSNELELPY